MLRSGTDNVEREREWTDVGEVMQCERERESVCGTKKKTGV